MTRARWAAALGWLALVWLALRTAPPPMPAFAEVRAAWTPSDAILLDRDGRELGRVRTDLGARRGDWTPLAAISPALPRALIAAEDHRFYRHSGVDWAAIGGALRDRLRGGPPRGASTITMQLAGLAAPELKTGRGRGLLAKIVQARAALVIERRWSKPQILEAYLNLASTRGELAGVDASARALFDRAPAGLTVPEAAAYVALFPSPRAKPEQLRARACSVARRAGAADCATALAAVDAMLLVPVPSNAPDLAPQLAVRLLRPGMRTLRTTLDAGIQAIATQALARRLAALDPSNARDGAAVVVDNATGEVLAYVASAGPNSRAGAVDGADAPRQAGSTLKPFLYALALDRRRLTAASLLDDSPAHLETASGLYVPQDYDRRFRGPVSVRSALGNSLNVPAVRALVLTGVDDFRDALSDAGYAHINEEGEYYGYSLALGSAEVTLLEQAAAYRALARGGIASPLRLTPGPVPAGARVFSPGAAAIVADILADPAARESTFGTDNALSLPFWAAVKTGTSKAMRDNWCIGFSTRFTVAVWVGNFEGDSMAGVSGVTGAAPAWREIMLALHPAPPPAPVLPPGLVRTPVRFRPAIEPPRDELFLPGSALAEVALAPPQTRPPRIVSPADGTVIALDPDIPSKLQKLALRVDGARVGDRLSVDGAPYSERVWIPRPGVHRFALTDAGGRSLDRARVSVR